MQRDESFICGSMVDKTAIACSVAFLGMYVAYHMTSDSTKFGGEGAIKYVYYLRIFRKEFL